ncbi:MAG: hypothetical protein AAGJ46_14620 [Planctomycetota bacterium]
MRLFRAIKLLLTLRCEESTRLMSDANHRKLTGVERWAVRLHKIGCSYCRKVAEQLRLVDEAAQKRVFQISAMPTDARSRIAAALREDAGSDRNGGKADKPS